MAPRRCAELDRLVVREPAERARSTQPATGRPRGSARPQAPLGPGPPALRQPQQVEPGDRHAARLQLPHDSRRSLLRRTSTITSPAQAGGPGWPASPAPRVCAAIQAATGSARRRRRGGQARAPRRHVQGCGCGAARAWARAAKARPGRRRPTRSASGRRPCPTAGARRGRRTPRRPAASTGRGRAEGDVQRRRPATACRRRARGRAVAGSARTRPGRRPGRSRSTACGRRRRKPSGLAVARAGPAKNSSVSAWAISPLLRRGVLHLVEQ